MNPHDIANAELIELLKNSLEMQATTLAESDDQERPEDLDEVLKNEAVHS